MENRKDIGKAFRDKLEQIENVPDASLWNRIDADLQKKNKSRKHIWIFCAIFILSIVGFTVRDSYTSPIFFGKNVEANPTSTTGTTAKGKSFVKDNHDENQVTSDAKDVSTQSSNDHKEVNHPETTLYGKTSEKAGKSIVTNSVSGNKTHEESKFRKDKKDSNRHAFGQKTNAYLKQSYSSGSTNFSATKNTVTNTDRSKYNRRKKKKSHLQQRTSSQKSWMIKNEALITSTTTGATAADTATALTAPFTKVTDEEKVAKQAHDSICATPAVLSEVAKDSLDRN